MTSLGNVDSINCSTDLSFSDKTLKMMFVMVLVLKFISKLRFLTNLSILTIRLFFDQALQSINHPLPFRDHYNSHKRTSSSKVSLVKWGQVHIF